MDLHKQSHDLTAVIILPCNRKYFGGDPRQRFLRNAAEGDGAVEGDGRAVLQGAPREAFLRPTGGIHVSVRTHLNTADRCLWKYHQYI